MIDAFYNGFPIVYSDTSTYIASGLELETPFDRPITYGLFLRLFSLNGLSLWFVVFFQALILSYLILLLTQLIIGEKWTRLFGLLIILLLSLLTGASWTVNQLMPDIFTPIGLISMVLILFGKFGRRTVITLYLLFFIAVAMHLSHLLLFSLILATIFIFKRFLLPKQIYPNANKQIVILLAITLASIVTMGSSLSKSKHVFLMGSLVEKGIIKQYLDENCATSNYKLCAYKDSLPLTFNDFVWKENSPLYKLGGWKETKREFNELIYSTLTHPKYIGLYIKESCKATSLQLVHFGVGDGNGSFLEGTLLYERISRYFTHDLTKYTTSKQSQSRLDCITFLNSTYSVIIALSLLALLLLFLIFKNSFSKKTKMVTILFLLAIILTAWDCGTFSMVADRFGCKTIWLIPFISILSFSKIWQDRRRIKDMSEVTIL